MNKARLFRRPRGLQPHAWVLTRALRVIPRTLAKHQVFKVEVVNREVVPATGRAIVACNHLSISDPVFLWAALRRNAVAIAMSELWRVPVVNLIMWLLGMIPVERGNPVSGKRAIRAATRQLENDGLLIIYPEEKCSRGELLPLKAGVAVLAFATGAPIIPAGIRGSNLVKPLRSKLWQVNKEHQVILRFGSLIDPHQFTGPNRVDDLLAELREQMLLLSAA
jgi:1-acyl-sn-glycerol-3-phosphate acyltransferase